MATYPGLANPQPFPDFVGYVWAWYLELQSGEALTYAEIKAWADITGAPVLGCEARLLLDLDRAKWGALYE